VTMEPELFAILACPLCRAPFDQPASGADTMVCSGCAASFPVVEGIPVLLPDRATRA
jgi:uncharacterized protein YbaR (Trm112 family)